MISNDNANTCTPSNAHHWVIPPAEGQSSLGVCKHCGGKRLFSNHIDDPRLWIRHPTGQEDRI
jgi:hypothetical protein